MALYAATIFLGSFLLFQVQPLIGKYILPWYGGSPAVWTTCMLFFQTALLAGYGYAHATTLLDRRRQGWLHLALLVSALLVLPLAPSAVLWKPAPGDSPVAGILLLLAATVGLPYLLLASSAPLIQHWFVRSFPGRSPYRLYALSNAASLLALLSYPGAMEPLLAVRQQGVAWSWGFGLYVLCCGLCAIMPLLAGQRTLPGDADITPAVAGKTDETTGTQRPPLKDALLWLLLSACGSAVLLATTNQLCQEVAVVPFLWVVPLALYLATFVVCFASRRASDRIVWGLVLAAALFLADRTLMVGVSVPIPAQALNFLAVLTACCMACHGELVRLQPAPRHLTAYYLVMALGGALGGASVALVAPLLFDGFWEFPLSLTAAAVAVALAWWRDGVFATAPRWLPLAVAAGLLAQGYFSANYIRTFLPETLASTRNFYGVLRVTRYREADGTKLSLVHGRVMHGAQYEDPARRSWPTTYYGPASGAGLALRYHPRRQAADQAGRALRVGVIGLGTGTLATYGQPGDTFRFYEINPEVTRLARQYFTFLKETKASIEVVPGDARLTLEGELAAGSPQRYDLLLVDAFSSDAIPVHLLTREAVEIYLRHLAPDGLLLFHVTNRLINLQPVVRGHGAAWGLRIGFVKSEEEKGKGVSGSDWLILARDGAFLDSPPVRAKLSPDPGQTARTLEWTDNFASLWQVVRR